MKHPAVLLLVLLGVAACGEPLVMVSDVDSIRDSPEIPSWAKVAPEQIAEAKKHGVPVAFENDLGMRFVLIPAGTFLMGSPEDEALRFPSETQQEVTVPEPFYIQVTEVTNGAFRRLNPDYDSGANQGLTLNGDRQPVAHMLWEEATGFAASLSAQDPLRTYLLPSEDHWEYACRAGATSAYWWPGDAEGAVGRANVADASVVRLWKKHLGQDHSVEPEDAIKGDDGHAVAALVGSFAPNDWGLYDMIGNVLEWCAAGSAPTREGYHVVRGGSWHHGPQLTRCAVNGRLPDGASMQDLGFRLVSPLPESSK